MPGGRPSKFDGVDMEQVKMLVSKGFTDAEMAKFVGVNLSTWTRWKQKHKEFCISLKDWKASADRKVERSLYERACGYKGVDTKFATHEGKIADEKEYIK